MINCKNINWWLTLLFNVIVLSGYTQKVSNVFKYKCYTIRKCDNKVQLFKDYYMARDGVLFYPTQDSQEVILPDTGTYVMMHFNPFLESDSFGVNVKSTYNTDTFQEISLSEVTYLDGPSPKGMSKGGGWEYCDKPANGYLVDYYTNGKKMLEGNFKNGLAVGIVKYYDKTGKLYSIEKYNRRGKLIKRYFVGLK